MFLNLSKKAKRHLARHAPVLLVTMLVAAQSAHAAAIDVTAPVAGIGEAGVAILALITALLAMSVSIFGLTKVYAFIRRKAGA